MYSKCFLYDTSAVFTESVMFYVNNAFFHHHHHLYVRIMMMMMMMMMRMMHTQPEALMLAEMLS